MNQSCFKVQMTGSELYQQAFIGYRYMHVSKIPSIALKLWQINSTLHSTSCHLQSFLKYKKDECQSSSTTFKNLVTKKNQKTHV